MDNNFYDSIFVSIASWIFKNNFSNDESRSVVLINSFVNNAMSCSCPEWTSCDLMTAFQKPPIIVRPYVPTNGADPATFGGQVRAPPRCPPYVFDITCALEWKGCVTKVTGFTQLVTGKRFDTIRTGEYPVAMAVGGVGHFISSILQI